MKHLYIVILLMMSGYILLNLYFDWRMEQWVKRYKKQINKDDELEQQKEEIIAQAENLMEANYEIIEKKTPFFFLLHHLLACSKSALCIAAKKIIHNI